jgi:hypothetical protein
MSVGLRAAHHRNMLDSVLVAQAPRTVVRAFDLIVVALLAGVAEAILRDGLTLSLGLGIRAAVYAAVFAIALRMRAGDRWARTTLAVGLGTVGLVSLLVEPAAATLSANGFHELVDDLTAQSVAIAVARIIHVIAVVVTLISMYQRDARRYFRTRRQIRSRRRISQTVPSANTAR